MCGQDSLAEFLISVGMRPIFELSFMPSWLSAPQPPAPTLLCAALPPLTLSRSLPLRCRSVAPGRNRTICHYKGNAGPPANFTEWGMLIGSLAEHMVQKFGEQTASEFFFEVARLSSRLRCAYECPRESFFSQHASD